MKTQLEQIVLTKKKKLKTLETYKNKALATIYKGLVKGKSAREIQRDIWNITSVRNDEIKNMYKYAIRITTQAKKRADKLENPLDLASIFIKEKWYKDMSKIAYKEVQKTEANEKESILKDTVRDSRNSAKVFYLASYHKDSATDHKDYQGKMYVDEKWRTITNNDHEIADYVRKNNVKTFQWVTGKPIWFITRPNCRHYFKVLAKEDVLGSSVNKLIKTNNMSSRIGNERTRTIAHSTSNNWYTEQNIASIIAKYEDRKEYHEMLYAVDKSPIIKRAIEKDEFLIKKWKKYLQNKK